MQPSNTIPPARLLVPLDKYDKLPLRHKWHRWIVAASTAITSLTILLIIAVGATMLGSDVFEKILSVDEYEEFSAAILLACFLPLLLLVTRTITAARYAASGAIASEQQFEYVRMIVEHYSALAGLTQTPTVAIVNDGGFVAKTASNFGKATILVHADLVDASRPNSQDWGALRFAIAREVGHIAAGHRDLVYELFTAVTQAVPYLSYPLLRAEAYTADRYGAVLAPDAAADYFAVEAVSKDCWLDMSVRASVARAGKARFSQMLTCFVSKTPPTTWRLHALAWFGAFQMKPLPSNAQSPADYRAYLKTLPTLPALIDVLDHHHAAFWLPPQPMSHKTLDALCPKGTNRELLAHNLQTTASDTTQRESITV
ncbi:hypothetical protein CR983_02490 [Candidatus Saccharibacteria bacterium]|nr:MAG: hypothetical protein CR983_02490 [Candidatus Saccharibacteria bacterium]